jgi:hypothetical protein
MGMREGGEPKPEGGGVWRGFFGARVMIADLADSADFSDGFLRFVKLVCFFTPWYGHEG